MHKLMVPPQSCRVDGSGALNSRQSDEGGGSFFADMAAQRTEFSRWMSSLPEAIARVGLFSSLD
jgi:hypothetical protein